MFPRKIRTQNNQFPLFALTDDVYKKFFISLAEKTKQNPNYNIVIDLIKVNRAIKKFA